MRIESRQLHPEQQSTNPSLLENQRRLFTEIFGNDIEIYDDHGNLLAITSRDNPNLDELLINLRGEG